MTAYLIVRAVVPQEDRADFDSWYEREHLPDAKRAFGAKSALRGWTFEDDSIHYAMYEFGSLEIARSALDSEALKTMVAEFDRNWQDRVTRSREIIEIVQWL